ncbi:hypothetical protein DPMN_109857 [Dreissena polymorpha]|uniref:Uncharacterized protein n=1 Tax=Dreissena polymorpha TaxID=45954 RepID=A0A9D4KBU0_DREPO|nr:hypothetical protein DPMN_109857 [Dreissena polymorpha]
MKTSQRSDRTFFFNARSLVRSPKLESAWSQDGTVLVKIANKVGSNVYRVYNQSDLDNLIKIRHDSDR